jgi:MoaA/NifB/PqqE/SkfB family radical SAM enzyme
MVAPMYISSPDSLPAGCKIYIYGGGGRGRHFHEVTERYRKDVVIIGYLDSFSSGLVNDLPQIRFSQYKHNDDNIIVVCSYEQLEIIDILVACRVKRFFVYTDRKFIKQLNLDISDVCNARCLFCAGKDNSLKYGNRKSWTLKEFEYAKPYIELVDEVSFCGGYGEALLNKHLLSMLQYIKSRNKKIRLFTNGTSLRQSKQSELIISLIDNITLSFVTLDCSLHDKMIGTSLIELKQNIKWLSRQPVALNANVIVTNKNYLQLAEIYIFFDKHKFRNITFNLMRDYGLEHLQEYAIKSPTELERDAWGRQLNRLKSIFYSSTSGKTYYNITNNLKERFETFSPTSCFESSLAKELFTRKCFQPWIQWFINNAGEIKPCCGPEQSMGNIFEEADIIDNQKHKQLKNALLTGKLTHGCKNCTIAVKCAIEELQAEIRENPNF